MERYCFVMMPISDISSYPDGHFKRVYEHIIKPACVKAGFTPLRADEVFNTNYIALDLIKHIINSDMAICDLSSKNPNVFYELGIRQSFNLPVTLIRDSVTGRVFDIQGFRDIEYDETLRIDNVEAITDTIATTIKNTYETKGKEINSLISLLGIHQAKVTDEVEISKDSQLILNAIGTLGSRITEVEKHFQIQNRQAHFASTDNIGGIWKDLDNEEALKLSIGDIIEHRKFGMGIVKSRKNNGQYPVATVNFENEGDKILLLNYVGGKIRKLETP